ncbi:hypothetical protein RhiirA4_510544 [Rhizophagus irregularis]|uniref:Mitochondrial import inner membrane translocase subunit TIM14 n=1 Tax=Rhizophagus irregularis TaxID=588596 RepID=A0A2I1GAI1_9GLOM|nr:hypothetical protein RhiirA4_510544 [Rhizophagus irregularis]
MATPFLIGVGIGTAGRFSIKATQKYKPSRTIRSVYYKGGFDNEMNKREAALILGLKNFINRERDINRAKIKEAYRKTLMLNHPDKGGSPYLASKIIEAKNFLEKVVRK